MNKKIDLVILSRTFAKSTGKPFEYLRAAGIKYELKRNNEPENEEKIASLIGDADAVIVGADRIGKFVLEKCKNLKVISRHGVGLDKIDLKGANERNIKVTVTSFANTESVADLTWLLILATSMNLKNRILKFDNIKQQWKNTQLGNEVCDKTIGLIGYGRIGRAVALRARGFRNRLFVYDPLKNNIKEDGLDITKVNLPELISQSDIISLHAPLVDETKHIINSHTLGNMKDGVIIVNTSRGELIDENALCEAFKSGKVKAAGLDVFFMEPPVNNMLFSFDNVISTPHIGAHSVEANYRMGMMASENVVKELLKYETKKL